MQVRAHRLSCAEAMFSDAMPGLRFCSDQENGAIKKTCHTNAVNNNGLNDVRDAKMALPRKATLVVLEQAVYGALVCKTIAKSATVILGVSAKGAFVAKKAFANGHTRNVAEYAKVVLHADAQRGSFFEQDEKPLQDAVEGLVHNAL